MCEKVFKQLQVMVLVLQTLFYSYEVQGLNGRDAIKALKISEDDFLFYRALAIDEV